MRDHADLTRVPRSPHARAQGAVVRTLRATAESSQRSLRARLETLTRQGRVQAVTPLWVVNGVSLTASADVIRELSARTDVARVVSDSADLVPSALPAEPTIAVTRAPQLWDAGLTGAGVVVANLDSGVDVTHPDLGPRWRGGTNSWYDPYGQHPTAPTDFSGHGTGTMGIAVGGDSGGSGIGVAPGATWIAARVFNDRGGATVTAVHQAFQWLLDPDGDPATPDAPRVVTASWSIGAGPSCDLTYRPDVQALRAAGILPVFSAGNFGPGSASSVSPANYPESLSVGAVDTSGAPYPPSSQGPSSCAGRTRVFPDLVAPGVAVRTADRFGFYQTVSGTSIAAPHVAGALALLLQADPELTPTRQQQAVTSAAADLGTPGPDDQTGSGRIDAAAARTWLAAAPDFALDVAPASRSVPAGERTTYSVSLTPRNGYPGPAQLSLAGIATGQAKWSFTPSVLTNGSWTSTLEITPARFMPVGSRPLVVTAGDGVVVHARSVVLDVTPPRDFTLSLAPAAATAPAGATTTSTLSVTPTAGWVGPAQLTVGGLPAAVGTASVTPTSVTGLGTAALAVTTVPSAPAGAYPVTVTATDGVVTRTATFTVTVAARDFTLSVSPTSRTVSRGGTAAYTVSVTPTGGFTGKVTLSRSALPSGTSASWSVNPVAVPGSSTLRIKPSWSTRRGTYTVVVTGTSGAVTHSVTITVVVS
ncbi:S8 family serine peptidase [Intrasporangium sp.]|uniref:S8 family serine peptidase n=1 Tax=Intrasporangium sp. TaxID=1925024 RepID=UPI0033657E21